MTDWNAALDNVGLVFTPTGDYPPEVDELIACRPFQVNDELTITQSWLYIVDHWVFLVPEADGIAPNTPGLPVVPGSVIIKVGDRIIRDDGAGHLYEEVDWQDIIDEEFADSWYSGGAPWYMIINARLANFPILPGSLIITVGAVVYTDNGEGELTSPGRPNNYINYTTGELTFSFFNGSLPPLPKASYRHNPLVATGDYWYEEGAGHLNIFAVEEPAQPTISYRYTPSSVKLAGQEYMKSTALEVAVTGPGTLSFCWAVDCVEGLTDMLSVYLDGWPVASIYGPNDPLSWAPYSIIIPSGSHTIKWEFWQGDESADPHIGWIDEIVWAYQGTINPNPIPPFTPPPGIFGMTGRVKAPFINYSSRLSVGGGGVLTFVGTDNDQAIFWDLVAIDPRPGEGPWPAVGRLQRPRYRVSPIRYGTKFYYGTRICYGDMVRWHSVDEVDSGITFTDASRHATNIYIAPKKPPKIRFGMHYKYGEVRYSEESHLYDRVTSRAVLE